MEKTPKEKAVELADKFLDASFTNARLSLPIHKTIAKACALIAVDERLNEINKWFLSNNNNDEAITLWNYQVGRQKYCNQVRTEINNL